MLFLPGLKIYKCLNVAASFLPRTLHDPDLRPFEHSSNSWQSCRHLKHSCLSRAPNLADPAASSLCRNQSSILQQPGQHICVM